MRADLATFLPLDYQSDTLMCCCCGRFLPKEDFSLEHIIPQSVIADDPPEVRLAIAKNERSKVLLLCNKKIGYAGKALTAKGCNSWKGRHFDPYIKNVLVGGIAEVTSGRRPKPVSYVAFQMLGYLLLVHLFGYQVVLTESGLLMRRQFFSPGRRLPEMPVESEVLFGGEPLQFDGDLGPWRVPFNFSFERGKAFAAVRNVGFMMPMSRDPTVPLAQHLRHVPSRFTIRPDFSSFVT